jgi:hypothetical protein
MATRTARLPVFAVSLATLGFGLFANTNIQAAGDTVWVTMGTSIAKYNPDGTAITNFITEPLPGQGNARRRIPWWNTRLGRHSVRCHHAGHR